MSDQEDVSAVPPVVVPAQDPITITIKDAKARSGLSETTIYDFIADGTLKTTMVGRRRLIYFDSFRQLLSQPAKPLTRKIRGPQRPRKQAAPPQSEQARGADDE
jgi:excisionase family DNA binding protein